MPLLCRVPWAPCNGTMSTPPKLAVTLPPDHSTLQWHPAMAPSNGTTSTAPCSGTLVPRPIRQSGSSPSPLIGSKNPYSYLSLDVFFVPASLTLQGKDGSDSESTASPRSDASDAESMESMVERQGVQKLDRIFWLSYLLQCTAESELNTDLSGMQF